MTEFSSLLQTDRGQSAIAIETVAAKGFEDWFKAQPERARTAVTAARFKGKAGSLAILPGDKADAWSVAIGIPDAAGPWDLAFLVPKLPGGTYRLAAGEPGAA